MLENFLEQLKAEDKYKLFTGEMHPNIYDAVSVISHNNNVKEIERIIRHYFEQVLQVTPVNSTTHYEAQRMLVVCDKIFRDNELASNSNTNPIPRDMNDEIVDFYMESLKHFASFLDEEILYEHIDYLDDKPSKF